MQGALLRVAAVIFDLAATQGMSQIHRMTTGSASEPKLN